MEEFIWSKVAKHINEEEFEKLTLEEKQVQCTNLYYFIREQFSRMNPELGVKNAQFDQRESQMTVPDSFPNSDSLSSDLEMSEEDNPHVHLGSSGHPSVQSLQEVTTIGRRVLLPGRLTSSEQTVRTQTSIRPNGYMRNNDLKTNFARWKQLA
jgi:hypothetical protein